MRNQFEESREIQFPGHLLCHRAEGFHLLDARGQGVLRLLALRDVHRRHKDAADRAVLVPIWQPVDLDPPLRASGRRIGRDDVPLRLAGADHLQVIGILPGRKLRRIEVPA